MPRSICGRGGHASLYSFPKWQVWEPRLRGINAEGKPSYSPELVPKHGTRKEFMVELRAAIETFLPHFWDHVLMQRAITVHEALKDNVTATFRSDYAAQIKTIRVHSATCAHPESRNLCITLVGHSPYEEVVQVKMPTHTALTSACLPARVSTGAVLACSPARQPTACPHSCLLPAVGEEAGQAAGVDQDGPEAEGECLLWLPPRRDQAERAVVQCDARGHLAAAEDGQGEARRVDPQG